MSLRELEHLSDRELLILVIQMVNDHLDDHKWWTSAYRWAVIALLTAIAAAATVVAAVHGFFKP